MNTAIYEGSGHTCHLEAPLLAWNKPVSSKKDCVSELPTN